MTRHRCLPPRTAGGPFTRTPAPAAPPRRGIGAVAVIVVLVALSALAAAVVRLGQQGHAAATQDMQATRASAAARSGIEWGLYQAFKGSWTACSSASQTLDLAPTDGGEMRVTVSCDMRSFNEGETAPGVPRVVKVYTVDAVACNSSTAATACPDAAKAAGNVYVERRRQVQAVE